MSPGGRKANQFARSQSWLAAQREQFSPSSVYRDYGIVSNPNARLRGRPRALDTGDVNYLSALLQANPVLYLDELQEKLLTQRGVDVLIATLLRTLRRLHFSRKCVSARMLERNYTLRSVYWIQIADMVPDLNMLIFIDEAAKNDRTSGCPKGWSLMGTCCIQQRAFVRGKCFSILPVLTLDGIIAHDVIEGSVNMEWFLGFLEEHVVRNLLCSGTCAT